MTEPEWRLSVSYRLDGIERFQRRQVQIWWGVFGTVALVVGQRFLAWLLDSGALVVAGAQ